MKSTKRALRRHHRERMLQRALRSCVLSYALSGEDPQSQREIALGWSNNLAKCSCSMCGNPRKYWGEITAQERRQLQAALDDIHDGRKRSRSESELRRSEAN